MNTSQKSYKVLVRILIFLGVCILLQLKSLGQASISGPNCIVPGIAYNYSISAYYSGSSNFTYTIAGGTLSTGGSNGTHTGPGLASVTITWSVAGTIYLSSPAGGASYSVTATTAFTPGSITSGGTQNINYGTTPATINCSVPSGGTCTTPNFVYQWQQSPDNINFYNVTGATGQNLSFSSGATQTMYYRRSSTETTGNNTGYTNVASVILNPPSPILPVNAGAVTPSSQYINYNTTPATLSSSGVSQGNYAYSYQWQSSPDSITWTNISSNIPFYSPGNLTSNMYYRVAVTSNSVTNYSTPGVIKVYPQLFGGDINPALVNITSGKSPGGLYCSAAVGGSGIYTYQWQSSTDGINFSNVTGATSLVYVPGNLSVGTWYRVMVSSNGATAYSTVAQVAVVSSAPDVSFVRTRTILKAGIADSTSALALTSPFDVAQVTQYIDGLGRPVQTVAMQQSPLQHDLVSLTTYDDFGREAYKYLPYVASTGDGNYKATGLADTYGFNAAQYSGEQYYFGQVNYEPSPLNRASTILSPGLSWEGAGRGVSTQYQVNTLSDSVRIWTIANSPGSIPTTTTIFAAGTLYKTVTQDEAGHIVVEYQNVEGKIVLKKVQLAASPGTAHVGWLCTYYVYDIMNNLRFVLQPSAVQLINANWNITAGIAGELCFRYEYDLRRRMVIKKIPGAGEQWTVYDTKNRVVMTQDSVLRAQHKWQFVRYDTLNRSDSTGLLTDATNYNNLTYHQNLAAGSTNYPVVSSYTNELLTQSFYDDYSWASAAGLPGTMATGITANSNNFVTSYNVSPVYAVNPVPLYITRGLTTGMMTKVLGTASQYLYTANFYDDRGRVVQSQAINYTGAVDTLTSQYDFSGKVVRNVLGHKKNGNTVQNHFVVTKMDYDHGGRLRHLYKNIDNAASDQLIDSIQYDELGRMRAKYLGNAVDSLVYDYNIRGWMTAINRSYLTGAAKHYFGMELAYDKNTAAISGTSYANVQFNGNIGGMIWRSGGDGVGRKYDFNYDNVNRLTAAAFTQNTIGTSWDSSAINFSVSNLSYDANGNILSMNQAGLRGLTSTLIDQLQYTYQATSNKLSQVTDGMNDSLSTLGDFHFKGAKQSSDYGYDGNGSLTHDNNKSIDTIIYNYLNLPQQVHMNGKGTILYTYDAAGNKLQKRTMDSLSRHATTTLYQDGFVYQQQDTITNPSGGTDTLQFLLHEEGRTRWTFHRWTNGTTGYRWEYDFFERDHLGNTREVLTQQRDTAQYMATMEAAYRATENALFYNIGNTNVWSGYVNGVGNNPFGTGVTNPNDSVCRISGSTPKEGPAIILKVMAGDVYKVGVQAYWKSGQTATGTTDAISDILSSLANGIVGTTGTGKGSYSTLSNTTTSPLLGGVNSFRNDKDSTPVSNPKAYLNYLALDDQFNYDPSASGARPIGGPDALRILTDSLVIKKNGYLYIYLTNETKSVSVFFDNLSVTHYPGPLLEETHYYPLGLTMAGISDKALKTQYAENKYRYNKGSELQNKEFSDGSGLELYETKLRELDPQLGRWWQVDSKPTMAESPYAAMVNNPILHNDPLGDSIPWPARVAQNINPMGATDWIGVASLKANAVRTNYTNSAAKIDPNDPTAKNQRVELKRQTRENTPEPFKSAVEKGRPMAGEEAKITNPKVNNPTKTNADVNELAETTGALGKIFVGAGVAVSMYNVATSPTPAKEAVSESTGWAGAVYVGGQFATGAAPYGPYASAGAGFVGGIIGFALGKEVGNAAMNGASAMKQGMAQYNEESKKEGCNTCLLDH